MSNQMMKVVVLEKIGKLTHEERVIPEPQEGQCLVKTIYAGICGSDVHAFHGLQPALRFPTVMGHELLGSIEKINGKTNLKLHQRVVVDPSFRCGSCSQCKNHRENICENLRVLGVHCDGGFSDFFIASSNMLHPVPESVSDELAIMAEPLSIAVHAADRMVTRENNTVMIIGGGPIGLALLIYLRDKFEKIVLLDVVEFRRKAAKELKADLVVNPLEHEDLAKYILDTIGELPSVIFDAVSNKFTAQYDMECISRGGQIIIVGMSNPENGLKLLPILKKELTVRGTRMTTKDVFPRVLDFLSTVDPSVSSVFITHFFHLDNFEEGFELSEKHPEKAIKVVIDFKK